MNFGYEVKILRAEVKHCMHHIESLNKEFCELKKEVVAAIKELHNAHCLMMDIQSNLLPTESNK